MTTFLLSGATGFVGSHLAASLQADGHRVVRLSRRTTTSASDVVAWDPATGRIDAAALDRAQPDVVVNLAGEPIAQRWTSRTRQRIRDSRVRATETLASALATLERKPAAFLSGSAIGYYGAHRGDELLDERSKPADDFLAQTAIAWETSTAAASAAGIRVVLLRTGVVLGRGGALARMVPPFKLGVGGKLGSGEQWMSWISITDVVRAIRFCADHATLTGAVNLVAPNATRNVDFVRALGTVLHRPAIFPVPAFVLEAIFGTMARDTILASQRVAPAILASAGFSHAHPVLEDALRAELRR